MCGGCRSGILLLGKSRGKSSTNEGLRDDDANSDSDTETLIPIRMKKTNKELLDDSLQHIP
eukprot:3429350-Amphidinium_carterae.2